MAQFFALRQWLRSKTAYIGLILVLTAGLGQQPSLSQESEQGQEGRTVAVPPGTLLRAVLDDVSAEIRTTDQASITSLQGYWHIAQGPARGWIVRGRDHGAGKVSLDTAPGVVIGGTWDRQAAPKVDLLPNPAGVTAFSGVLEDGHNPPFILNRLLDVTAQGPRATGRGRVLQGVATEEEEQFVLEQVPWRVEIQTQPEQSTRWFEPADGAVAQLIFKREPEHVLGIPREARFLRARLRVLAPDGNPLQTAYATTTADASSEDGSLTLHLADRWVNFAATWTGKDKQGESLPSGLYTLELVVRDGMAEQTLTHTVSLGASFAIRSLADHFAPEHEKLPIDYVWFPERSAPRTVRLIVRGGAQGREPIYAGDVVPAQITAGWRVAWSGRTTTGRAVDWARLKPFRIELEAVGEDGVRRTARAQTPVDVLVQDFKLAEDPPDRPQGEAAGWYGENEIPADTEFMPATAVVTILDSQNRARQVKEGVDVKWTFELEPGKREIQPRTPGFYTPRPDGTAPDPKSQSPRDALIQAIVDPRVEGQGGRSAVFFRLPSRATWQDWGTRAELPADRFTLKASLASMPQWEDTSRQYTIGPGTPYNIRQLLPQSGDESGVLFGPGASGDVFCLDESGKRRDQDTLVLDPSKLDFVPMELTEYVDNTATYLLGLGLGSDVSGLKKAVHGQVVRHLGDRREHAIRYIGGVRDVPYRGYLQSYRIDLPVFLAGYAGADHGKLQGGQALLVLFQVADKYCNPIPVTGKSPDDRKPRTIATAVRSEAAGIVPPFVISSATGDTDFRYGAAKNYSPFGPGTGVVPPLGIHGLYYVPGIQPISAQLATEFEALNKELQKYGERLLVPPPIPEIDDSLSIFVTVDGSKTRAALSGIRLAAPGTVARPPSVLAKWLKWLVFAEVADLETFKAEIVLGVIPLIGDGRDIIIYYLKEFRGDQLSTLDNVLWYVAVIGLLSDLGDVNPVGIVWNGFVASTKALLKAIKTAAQITSKFVEATGLLFKPFIVAAKRTVHTVSDAPLDAALNRSLFRSLAPIEPLGRGITEGIVDVPSLLKARVQTLGKSLDGCNPSRCLMIVALLENPTLIARLLDKAGFALDDLYALGINLGKQENIVELAETGRLDALLRGLDDAQMEELFEKLLTFGKLKQPLQDYTQALIALEGKHGVALTDGMSRLAGTLADPYATIKALQAIAGLPREVVEQARGVLVSAEFLRAVQRQQDVLPILVQALQNYGKDGALLFRQAAGSTEEYVTLVEAIKLLAGASDDTGDWVRHLNNILGKGVLDRRYVIPGLMDIGKAKHFAEIGGADGLRKLVDTLDKIADNVSTHTQDVATATLEIARKFDGLAAETASSRLRALRLEDIVRVYTKLEPHEYAATVLAVERLALRGAWPGSLTQAKLGDVWLDIIGRSNEALERTRGASRNFANIAGAADSAAARGHAFEVVFADWLAHGGTIKVVASSGGGTRRIGKEQLKALGAKIPIGEMSPSSFEADIGAVVDGKAVVIDCKCYREAAGRFAELADDDVLKAVKALNAYKDQIAWIAFLSSKPWGDNTLKKIRNVFTDGIMVDGKRLSFARSRLLLGEVEILPGSNLAMFLGK